MEGDEERQARTDQVPHLPGEPSRDVAKTPTVSEKSTTGNDDVEANESDSLVIRQGPKKFVVRLKPIKRLSNDDHMGNEDEEVLGSHAARPADCCKKMNRWCRRMMCCRGINLLRLADGFCLRGCCCFVDSQKELQIDLPVKSLEALLDSDSTFAFPRVNSETVEYLIKKAWDQILPGQQTKLVVQTLGRIDTDVTQQLSIAFNNSFRYEAKMSNYELISTSADGCASCIMSTIIVIVVFCILIPIHVAVVVFEVTPTSWLMLVDGIGIIIMWVAVWHPVELLIYGRHMIRMRHNICNTLADSTIVYEVIDPTKTNLTEFELNEILASSLKV